MFAPMFEDIFQPMFSDLFGLSTHPTDGFLDNGILFDNSELFDSGELYA